MKLSHGLAIFGLLLGSGRGQAQEVLDSNSLGQIHACSPLANVRSVFPSAKDTVVQGEAASHWPARIVHLDAGTWVIFESSWADTGRVWTIRTNSDRFRTPSGYRVGTRIGELLARKEPLSAELAEGQLGLGMEREGVGFGIDQHSADVFLRTWKVGTDPTPLLMPEARITTLSAGSDCR